MVGQDGDELGPIGTRRHSGIRFDKRRAPEAVLLLMREAPLAIMQLVQHAREDKGM